MPWRRKAPGHQQPWYSICPCVWSFPFIWVSIVLDSCSDNVKCPIFFLTKAFLATKTPWVELCFGSVGEKIGIIIFNIGAGTQDMVSARQDQTLEPFVSTFLWLALAWMALFDSLWWGPAWQRLPLKSRRAAARVVDFISAWSRSRLVCGRPGGRPLRWWSIFMSLACMVYTLEGQATFMDILWTRTCATGWFYNFKFGAFGYLVRRMSSRPLSVDVVVPGCGLGDTV